MNETHFHAVVIGSGFGGSVMTYRLAEAGLRVCLLERGKAYPPGSFPRSPYRMRKNFWDPSEGLHGLYNFWGFRGLDMLASSGLGGGSLIDANVLLRKDEKWFVKEDVLNGGGYEYWPVTRVDRRGDLRRPDPPALRPRAGTGAYRPGGSRLRRFEDDGVLALLALGPRVPHPQPADAIRPVSLKWTNSWFFG